MAYKFYQNSTTEFWVTKAQLETMKSDQLTACDFILNKLTQAEATKLIKSASAILTSMFKIPVVGDLVNELASLSHDVARDEKDKLYSGALDGWGTMYDLLSAWNSKIGLFKYDIVRIKLVFPTAVYRDHITSKQISIINKAGWQTAAVDSKGNQYLS